MEDVITDLNIKTSMFESQDTIDKINRMIFVLYELISYTFGKLLGPNIPDPYVNLVDIFQPDDLIIIFNYDLLIESAMKQNNGFSEHSYQIHPYKVQNRNNWSNVNTISNIELYKLHGSINWVKCGECNSILILDERKFRSNIFNHENLNNIDCPRCNENGNLKRLIIPPIQFKNYNEYPFRYLWRRASKKIRNIGRIASLGYSLPNTDYSTRSLLRLLLKYKRMGDIQLITMNTSTTAERKYLKMFPGITELKREESIDSFVNTFQRWE